MTIVILDALRFAATAEQLPVFDDMQVLTAPVGNVGPAERVIYIADLNAGGKKHQMDILRDNPQVGEWLVLSVGTEEDSWQAFQDNIGFPVQTFSSVEELIRAMERPAVRMNSCLVLSKRATPDADELIELLKLWMPDWEFDRQTFENDPEICFHTTCSRIILLGNEPDDFYGLNMPENALPLIVIPRLEEKVLQSIHPDRLIRDVFRSIEGLAWSRELQKKNFYFVSAAYERFRLSVRKEPYLVNSLAMDRRFDMWDRYGLPECKAAYTNTRMVEFLSQFDGCERIAVRLMNKTD